MIFSRYHRSRELWYKKQIIVVSIFHWWRNVMHSQYMHVGFPNSFWSVLIYGLNTGQPWSYLIMIFRNWKYICQYNDSCIQCHNYYKTDIGVHSQTFSEEVNGSDLNQIQLNEFGIVTELEKSFRPLNIGKGVQCPSCNLKIYSREQETVLLSVWTTINIAIMIIRIMMMMMIIHGANTFTTPF